jgi:hypothetical protein
MSSEGEKAAETAAASGCVMPRGFLPHPQFGEWSMRDGNFKQTPLIGQYANELVYSVPSVAGASRQMTVHLPLPQTGMTVEAGNDAIEFLYMVIKRVRRELAKLEATRSE